MTFDELLQDVARYGDDDERSIALAAMAGRRYVDPDRKRVPQPSRYHGGTVYYIGDPKGDKVKIGYSVNVVQRLEALRHLYQNPRLQILATEPGNWRTEKDRHRMFRTWALGSEWFKRGFDVREHIADLRG